MTGCVEGVPVTPARLCDLIVARLGWVLLAVYRIRHTGPTQTAGAFGSRAS